ncbi:MAG TPA: S26 family signal peptidase [Thiobacillus sp.]|jgi:conjugative transfer signal peptidase TraF|uniref:S26 family signal peptidase n=1 Tax=unclassified Acidovorax TaxID=2684926 RepID=UPI000BDCCD4F|nr:MULTISPECIES: S26 family signal peptidase [unclassified Acidovorax]OYY27132.1 MAG: S26 family signal peptidase [Acidovorax sp. 35-64-16]OZA67614.1 MAG: S26 family signal peptidase [Acidovorax sp. 39-64-12]HQS65280.1 S26 family signal peptidase [Acidovorax defluvii]HQT71022.1 S26 family signal peptidase [Thiobacillus sp.]
MKRAVVILCMDIGLAALLMPLAIPNRVHLVYNPSYSVPRGWYRIGPADSLQVGSIVLARLPAQAAALAAQRGYLPAGIPLLKRIGAVAPQWVCVDGASLRIDNVAVATVMGADGHGRPLSAWQQCRGLAHGELFLLSNTNPASFDSRYFGPIRASDVIGRAQPIWTWSTP